MGIMCNNGADDGVHLTVSVCTVLGNKAAVCMCMTSGDSYRHKISTEVVTGIGVNFLPMASCRRWGCWCAEDLLEKLSCE